MGKDKIKTKSDKRKQPKRKLQTSEKVTKPKASEPTEPPKPVLAQTLKDWVSQSQVYVNDESDVGYLAHAVLGDVVPRAGWRDPSGRHPICHIGREMLLLQCTRDAVARLHPNQRACRFLDFHGKPRLKWGCGFGARAAHDLLIEYLSWSPNVYAGDLARSALQTGSPEQPVGCDFGMMVDIYNGTGEDGVARQSVLDLCLTVATRTTYVLTWQLREPIGAMVFQARRERLSGHTVVRSSEVHWRSTADGTVEFYGDAISTAYAPSPVYSGWLDQRCVQVGEHFLHIAPVNAFGDNTGLYAAYVVVAADTEPLAISRVPVPTADIYVHETSIRASAFRAINAATAVLRGHWGPSHDTQAEDQHVILTKVGRRAYVSRALTQRARSSMGVRTTSGLLIHNIFSELLDAARQRHDWCVAETKWPGFVNSLVINSLTVALVDYYPRDFVNAVADARQRRSHIEAAHERLLKPGAYDSAGALFGLRGAARLAGLLAAMYAAFRVFKWVRWKMPSWVPQRLASLYYALVGEPENAWMRWKMPKWDKQRLASFYTALATTDEPGNPRMVAISSALAEEAVRTLSPNGMAVTSLLELALFTWRGVPLRRRVAPLMLHAGCDVIARVTPNTTVARIASFALRAAIHVAYNLRVVGPPPPPKLADSAFQDWAWCWARGHTTCPEVGVYPIYAQGVRRLRSFVPRFQQPDTYTHYIEQLRIKQGNDTYVGLAAVEFTRSWHHEDCSCDHLGLCDDCRMAQPNEFVYPLLVTNGLLWAPRPGNASLAAALLNRVLRDPHDGRMATPRLEEELYADIADAVQAASVWMSTQPLRFSEELTIDECAAAMGGAKGRNLLETAQRMDAGIVMYCTRGQEKWNEQIKCKARAHIETQPSAPAAEGIDIKPRFLCAVSTDDQVVTTQAARELGRIAKAWFNGVNIQQVGNQRVRFCIAQTTAEQLNAYPGAMNDSIPFVLVLGDDTMYSSGGQRFGPFQAPFGESDYEQYDQTQLRPLWEAMAKWATAWNAPPGWVELLYTSVTRLIKAGKKHPTGKDLRPKIKAAVHPQMASGIAVTSIFGSLFNILNYAHAILNDLSIEVSSAQLGLKIKHFGRDRLEDVTFLRGWWQPTPAGAYHWANLPSLALKMGKLFKDPAHLVRGSADYPTKCGIVFAAMLESLRGLPEDYPILGAYARLARRLAGRDERLVRLLNDPYIAENARWKVYGHASCNRAAVLDAMYRRYAITKEEVEECESLILGVSHLPMFVSHPVFQKMQGVDYA